MKGEISKVRFGLIQFLSLMRDEEGGSGVRSPFSYVQGDSKGGYHQAFWLICDAVIPQSLWGKDILANTGLREVCQYTTLSLEPAPLQRHGDCDSCTCL